MGSRVLHISMPRVYFVQWPRSVYIISLLGSFITFGPTFEMRALNACFGTSLLKWMNHDSCGTAGFMRVCLVLWPGQHPSCPAHNASGKFNGSPGGDIACQRLLRELLRDAYGTLGGRSQVEWHP
ncbi:hypothetical protein LY76DRAFT_311083 [Colletotrichum caudatum]|nr:hypothetical protein LY76DRAFT_311083 [Colletotrichum caudatum]